MGYRHFIIADEVEPMALPDRLPKPDQYGNYWLGVDKLNCPVIFHAGSEPQAPKNARGHFASMGHGGGIIFDGSLIRYFESPQLALEFLREGIK